MPIVRKSTLMKTVITDSPSDAASFIKAGGLAAFPTETVYGLGAAAFSGPAIEKIFVAKGRPADNPLIVHIAALDQMKELAAEITASARKFIDVFFPGPLTVVLKRSDRVPLSVTAGLNTVAIRMPRNSIAREFLRACDTPVAAPSANLSGRPSPTTWQAVMDDLNGRIDCVLRGDPTEIGLESTVVDCVGRVPIVLRHGAVSLEDLREVVPTTQALSTTRESEPARSPGVRHKHYSPTARVILIEAQQIVDDQPDAAYIGITKRSEHFALTRICRSTDAYAKDLFEFLRECDRLKIPTIYCEKVETAGIGWALMDRLRRAAEK